jgi:hypothetical protein
MSIKLRGFTLHFNSEKYLRIAVAAPLAILLASGCVSRAVPSAADHFRALNESDLTGEVQLRLVFGGDTAFGESYLLHDTPRQPTKRFTRLCQRSVHNLHQLTRTADATIVNLETPITSAQRSPLQGTKSYIHWADPKLTPRLLKRLNVRCVSLGNNHSLDYGARGLKNTQEELSEADIEVFGAGENETAAARPWSHTFSTGGQNFTVAILGGMYYRPRYESQYGFYAGQSTPGINLLNGKTITRQMKNINEHYPDAFTILFPHWGKNYRRRTAHQKKLAGAMMEAGADLVLGHGAHMFQKIEPVRNRWVIYSLGNFVFNSPGRFGKKTAHPFSLVAVLVVRETSGNLRCNLRLYPVVSNNRVTDFQPRFLTKSEFAWAQKYLLDWSDQKSILRLNIRAGKDETGRFLWIPLKRRKNNGRRTTDDGR